MIIHHSKFPFTKELITAEKMVVYQSKKNINLFLIFRIYIIIFRFTICWKIIDNYNNFNTDKFKRKNGSSSLEKIHKNWLMNYYKNSSNLDEL